MEVDHATSLLVLSLGAFVIPLLSERMRLPAAIGEILFGILISQQALGLIQPTPLIRFLADFGFAFLMFLVGMEIDFSRIEVLGRRGLLVTGGAALLVFVLAVGVVGVTEQHIFMAVVLGAMSVGLLLAALKDLGEVKTDFGQTVLLTGSIGEFYTIIFLTAADIAVVHGVGGTFVFEFSKLLAIFGIAWLLLVLLRTLIWWFPGAFARVVTTHDASELGVRAAFALMLSFVAVAALLGVKTILGAFIAGALFSFVFREKAAVESKLSSIGFGFFVPIFFIDVGMSFDLHGVLAEGFLGNLAFLAFGSLIPKILPMALLVLVGLRMRQSLAAGVILAAPLTLLVAISKIGVEIAVISPSMGDAIVAFAVLSGIVYPIGFRALLGARARP
jgi:Kef-type K+ transport system membrane component KefB